ncbi:type 1 pili tip component [Candidatus Reidiella endopervernicosa]|uniref:Type 1 pili tip component n=1 Tax=Candidatus Reidiella endopervernicosa TaxID=2738883 RepID=A0A6N0HS82_9GAMM|nr:type 1 pili tip component [Candidatus Reidiella endopervernicosa]QKQ25067.1 type 1 pili tip component [Candidatus Reidiella endopervernicosa]
MNIKQLITQWDSMPKMDAEGVDVCFKISRQNMASIEAISELYPGLSTETVISQLLATALSSYQEALPYVPGEKVVAEDELGDPIFEDVGLTPRYLELVRKHAQL